MRANRASLSSATTPVAKTQRSRVRPMKSLRSIRRDRSAAQRGAGEHAALEGELPPLGARPVERLAARPVHVVRIIRREKRRHGMEIHEFLPRLAEAESGKLVGIGERVLADAEGQALRLVR